MYLTEKRVVRDTCHVPILTDKSWGGGGHTEEIMIKKQVSQGCFHDESQTLIIPFNWSSAIIIPENSETLYDSCEQTLPNKGFTNGQ